MWVLAKDVADKLFMIVNAAMTSIVMFVINVLLQFGITVYPRRLRSEAGQHYGTLHASIHFDWILLQLQSCRSGVIECHKSAMEQKLHYHSTSLC